MNNSDQDMEQGRQTGSNQGQVNQVPGRGAGLGGGRGPCGQGLQKGQGRGLALRNGTCRSGAAGGRGRGGAGKGGRRG